MGEPVKDQSNREQGPGAWAGAGGRLIGLFRPRAADSDVVRKIKINTGWLFADRIFRMAVGLVVGAWLARYLGPERFGLLSYALALTTIFSVLVGLGIENLIVRDLVACPAGAPETLGTAFVLKLAGGITGLALSVLATVLLRGADNPAVGLVAIIGAGLIFQSLEVIDFHFQARVDFRSPVLARGAAFVLISAYKAALILSRASLPMFALAWLGELMLVGASLLAAYRRTGVNPRAWRFVPSKAIGFLRLGWPLALTALAAMLHMRVDQVMLGGMAGPAAVGEYAAAVKISEMWYFLPATLVISAFPAIVEARGADVQRYRRRLQKLYNLMTRLSIPVALLVTFFSGFIVRAVFGPQYAAAAPLLSIHIWSSIFVLHQFVKSRWTLLENLQLFGFACAVTAAAVNIVLNAWWIPGHGAAGAAAATLCAHGLAVIFLPLFNRRDRVSAVFFLRSFFPCAGHGSRENDFYDKITP